MNCPRRSHAFEADPACAVMRARRRNSTATASEARVARPLRLVNVAVTSAAWEVTVGRLPRRAEADGGADEELGPYGLDTQRMLRAL